LREKLKQKECKLEFLSSYSSDFNLIEYSFSVLKFALKREISVEGNEDEHAFSSAIVAAAMNAITPEVARNQFRHCFVKIP